LPALDEALAELLDVPAFEFCVAGFAATIVEARSLEFRFIGSRGAFVAYQVLMQLRGVFVLAKNTETPVQSR
jgi:hypothetical protein